MFVDSRTLPDSVALDTDICIVGAGAAGITLAREFAGGPMRIVLCESGGFELDPDTQDLNTGANAGLPYFPLAASRLRFFGGTTNHWGGICRPFEDGDFAARPWVPRSGWPISGSDLHPYYARAQTVCGVGSPEWAAEHWLRRDRFPALPLSPDTLVTRIAQVVPSRFRRFAQTYRSELAQARNVTVHLNATVTELETDTAGGTLLRAHLACLGGNRFTLTARHFILAAGAIENARILLLSRRHHPAGLANQHDQVGRYFMEHPRLVTGTFLPSDRRVPLRLYTPHHVAGTTVKGYGALTSDVLRREGMLDVQIDFDAVYHEAFTTSLGSGDVSSLKTLARAFRDRTAPDDFRRHVNNVLADVMTWRTHTAPVAPFPLPSPPSIHRVWQAEPADRLRLLPELFGEAAVGMYAHVAGALPVEYVQVTTRIEQSPNPASRVTLMTERDALGLPRPQLDWRLTALDRHSMTRALELLGAELGRTGLGRLRITVPADDSGWPADLRGGWHHIGTTRMGTDPRYAVVDRNCQAHGLSNLFIAGSSVFPTAGSGTPTLTLVALALRLADYLKERVR